MLLLMTSAAIIGFVHSLIPGHWLPVVLMAKARKWPLRTALTGAAVAASGHILVSVLVSAVSIYIGAQFLESQEEQFERYASLLLVGFGLAYSAWSYFAHSGCHGHGHHGPDPDSPEGRRAPFAFLFGLGLMPCLAVFPVFAAAASKGMAAIAGSMLCFSIGVVASLQTSTLLVSLGVSKLDHPWLEHHGDLVTGFGIVATGMILFAFPI